jgi:XRE family transcriptional regulator, stress-response regulator
MTLLRRVLGDTLRGRRLRQRRTLREVSGAARVSLGYLSEVERGQKEASSELLASICDALDVKLSDLLSEVSETMRRSERAAEVARMPGRVTIPAPARPARRPVPAGVGGPSGPPAESRDEESFDKDRFDEGAFDEAQFDEAQFADVLEAASEPAPATDSLATLPDPGEELELDDVDLAELETGDGLGELEVLVGLTDLAGTYQGRCLAAA